MLEVGQGGRLRFHGVLARDELDGRVPAAGQQLLAGAVRHRDRDRQIAAADREGREVDRHLRGGVRDGGELVEICGGGRDAGDPKRDAVAEEDLGEGLAHDRLDALVPPHERLGGMFAG